MDEMKDTEIKPKSDNLVDLSTIKTEVTELDVEKSENYSVIDSRNIKKERIDLDLDLATSESGSSRNIKKEPNEADITTSDEKSLMDLSDIKKEQFDDLFDPKETCEKESENKVATFKTATDNCNIKTEIPDELDEQNLQIEDTSNGVASEILRQRLPQLFW
jgi:hypothetical protein